MNRQISQLTLKPTNLLSLKSILVYLFILIAAGPAMAQHINTSASQSPTGGTHRDTVKVMDIREKLVQLAMQNPSFEVADRQLNKSIYELKKAKASWLNPISGQVNVNEASIHQPLTGGIPAGTAYYPRWNIGLMVPLDLFATKKNDIKIAKENVLISEAEKNQRYREIRAEVLSAYEDYLMFKELLDIQARVTQDQFTILQAKEQDYKDGLINSEEYNKYFAAWSEEKGKQATARRNLNNSKIAIEAMIGIPLEQALSSK
jgi:outer membrane protein TolC